MTDVLNKLRSVQVKRYPICYVNRDQSVAEHSFCVMLVAMALIEGTTDEKLYAEVLAYSLMHDMDEVETGDIPSPFKRKLRRECPAVIPVLDGVPKVGEKVRGIVKLADMLEALFYIDEFGGSRTTEEEVRDDIHNNFIKLMNEEGFTKLVGEGVVQQAKRLRSIL